MLNEMLVAQPMAVARLHVMVRPFFCTSCCCVWQKAAGSMPGREYQGQMTWWAATSDSLCFLAMAR
jgi:hypothetical protein